MNLLNVVIGSSISATALGSDIPHNSKMQQISSKKTLVHESVSGAELKPSHQNENSALDQLMRVLIDAGVVKPTDSKSAGTVCTGEL